MGKFNNDQLEALLDKIVELLGEEFNGSVGLRGDDYQYTDGQELQDSRFWEDGIETSETLNGTSALLISADWQYDSYKQLLNNLKKHANKVFNYGDSIYVIVGEPAMGGEDIGEIIIPSAKVLLKVGEL